jgi:hypothetical protein
MAKVLGYTRVKRFNQVTMIKEVAQFLNAVEGDIIAFYENADGVLMTKAELTIIKPKK